MSDDTGRIRRPLTPGARHIVFASPSAAELNLISEVDRAHVVMLAEERLVDPVTAGILIAEIERLRACGFAPLLDREARRGVYLLYEDWLSTRLGEGVAGRLRTGRSRNDLNATVFLLGLRPAYQRLVAAVARLQAVLLRRGARHGHIVMPIYTHHQPAFPATLGHYWAGVATALDRDLAWLSDIGAGLDRCPLGAGAGGGTGVPIHPERTAQLLGFAEGPRHSLDAVAAREPALRLGAAAAVLGVTLSRLACDLTLWTTAEFGFLTLPDELVGSSSLMPQKRNPFLLEHVKGRTASSLGAFVTAATAMHATPFTNSIAAGTEGCAPLPAALDAVADAAALLGLLVAGARPEPEAMAARAAAGRVTATAAAEELAATDGLSFREAHYQLGSTLNAAEPETLDLPEPAAAVAAARHGAGPGAPLVLADLRQRRAIAVAEMIARSVRWRTAGESLDEAVGALIAGAARPPVTV